MSRSRDTEESPASILRRAIGSTEVSRRDPLATSLCLAGLDAKPLQAEFLIRYTQTPLRISFRKSFAVPNFHPFASKRIRLSLRIVVIPQSFLSCVDDRSRCITLCPFLSHRTMKTAGETPNRFARRQTCRMLSSRSAERISDTTPWLPISGSPDGLCQAVLFHQGS
jgi:hypothetical protein